MRPGCATRMARRPGQHPGDNRCCRHRGWASSIRPPAWHSAPGATSGPGSRPGAFTPLDAGVALSAVAGGLLGLLRLCQDYPERMNETIVDQLAEAIPRLLGVPAEEAARLAALPAADAGGW